MTDRRSPSTHVKVRTEFLFKRFFESRRTPSRHDPDLQQAALFWDRLGQFTPPAESGHRPLRQLSARVAASVAALICATLLLYAMAVPEQPWRSFATTHGGKATMMLDDGSRISLAAKSRVDVRFGAKKRELRLLAGQALFEVAHDPKRPFIVRVREGAVTAVGTAFNIRLDRHDAEVTVVNGIVDVGVYRGNTSAEAASVARAVPGEQIKFGIHRRNGEAVMYFSRRTGVDLSAITAWTRGKLFFDGDPLSEAIDIVNAYATKPVYLKDSRLASMPVFGILDQGDVNGLLVLVNDKNAIATVPDHR